MADTLLQTKLYPPSLRPSLISRPRLIEKISAGLDGKLTLIAAPAGFGKTTLIADWGSHFGRENELQPANPASRFCWLSLSANDNFPDRFLYYLIAAFQTIEPTLGKEIGELLSAQGPTDYRTCVTLLLNSIANCSIFIIVVLDDYHLITEPTIHTLVESLIDFAPPNLHIIIATRALPPLPLARWRAKSQLTALEMADLRFSQPESNALLNQMLSPTLDQADIVKLNERAEGWVTGLQLAALSLQAMIPAQRTAFIDSFAGQSRLIADYLVAEVLAQAAPILREFLLYTAFLEEMCASLCGVVCGSSTEAAQNVLEELEAVNLFILPLDDQRQWFRYHHLLRDYLRAQVAHERPHLISLLRRRAARWYAEHDYLAEAIEQGLLAEDWEWVIGQLEALHGRFWTYHQVVQLRDWCLRLPPERLIAAPVLHLYFTWGQLILGDLVTVRAHLPQLERVSPEIADPEWQGLLAIVQANEVSERDLGAAVSLYEQALTTLPKESLIWRGGAYISFGLTLLNLDELDKAHKVLNQAIACNQAVGNVYGIIFILYHVGEIYQRQGRLQDALAAYERGLLLATQSNGEVMTIGAWVLLGKGQILWEWNHEQEALELIIHAVQLAKKSNDHKLLVTGLLLLTHVQMVGGHYVEARELWQNADQIAQSSQMQSLIRPAQLVRVRLFLAQEDIISAEWWLQHIGLLDVSFASNGQIEQALTVARWLLQAEQYSQAESYLQHVLDELPSIKRGAIVHVRLLLSLVYFVQAEREKATAVLQPVLEHAQREGYKRLFLDEGSAMVALLQNAKHQAIDTAWLDSLLSLFTVSPMPASLAKQALIDPLSHTEIALLHLLAQGFTNQQIATERTITLNTVKWHLKNVYGKLGVSNRTAAVTQAQKLGLI